MNMDQRARRILAIGLPAVLVVAGVGVYLGSRRHAGGCAASFPAVKAAKADLPAWHKPAEASQQAQTQQAQTQQAQAAKGANAAVGVGPFGAWVAAAYQADDTRNLSGAHPVTFFGTHAILTTGSLDTGLVGPLAAIDPGTGTSAWTRGYSGAGTGRAAIGGPADTVAGSPSALATAQVSAERHDLHRTRVASVNQRGGLNWCTAFPAARAIDNPHLSLDWLANGALAVLHDPTSTGAKPETNTAVTLLNGQTGKQQWSVSLQPLANRAGALRPGGVRAFGDQVLVTPFGTLTDNDINRYADSGHDLSSPYPIIALDAATGHEAWRYAMAPTADGANWAQEVVATTRNIAVVLGVIVLPKAATSGVAQTGASVLVRMAGVDRSGHDVWQVDNPSYPLLAAGRRGGVLAGDLLIGQATQGVDAAHPASLVAYRVTDGKLVWTAGLTTAVNAGLGEARSVGDFLLVPGLDGVAVVDVRSGRQVGIVGDTAHGRINAAHIAVNDRYIVISGDRGMYVWERGAG